MNRIGEQPERLGWWWYDVYWGLEGLRHLGSFGPNFHDEQVRIDMHVAPLWRKKAYNANWLLSSNFDSVVVQHGIHHVPLYAYHAPRQGVRVCSDVQCVFQDFILGTESGTENWYRMLNMASVVCPKYWPLTTHFSHFGRNCAATAIVNTLLLLLLCWRCQCLCYVATADAIADAMLLLLLTLLRLCCRNCWCYLLLLLTLCCYCFWHCWHYADTTADTANTMLPTPLMLRCYCYRHCWRHVSAADGTIERG